MTDYSDTYYTHKIVPLDNFRRQKYNQYISLFKESVKPPIAIKLAVHLPLARCMSAVGQKRTFDQKRSAGLTPVSWTGFVKSE